jgi:hypothetical protein
MSVNCKKLKTRLALLVVFLLTCAVSPISAETSPNKIPYPADHDTSDGASGVEGKGDHKKTPYFAHPDVYNLKSGGSLTILEKFKTYQQATENFENCKFNCTTRIPHYSINYSMRSI